MKKMLDIVLVMVYYLGTARGRTPKEISKMNHLDKRIASALENKKYFHKELIKGKVSQEAYNDVEKYYFDLLEERKRREEK